MKNMKIKKLALWASLSFVSLFAQATENTFSDLEPTADGGETPVEQVEAPQLVAANGCGQAIQFTIQNYDASLTYNLPAGYTQSGSVISYAGQAVAGQTYTLQITATNPATAVTSDASNAASQVYKVAPAQPALSSTVSCARVVFQLDSYNSDYTYRWTLNGVAQSATGSTLVATGFANGETLQAAVVVSHLGCEAPAVTQSATFVSTPQTPQLQNNDGCAKPVQFTLNNPDARATYKWEVNGIDVTAQVQNNVYTEANPFDGQVYQLVVVASPVNQTDAFGCKSQASISQLYKPAPPTPVVDKYVVCQYAVAKRWTDLLLNYNASKYQLVWFSKTGAPLSAQPTAIATDVPDVYEYQVAYKDIATGCTGPAAPISAEVVLKPTPIAATTQTICVGTQVEIGVPENLAFSYEWVPSEYLVDANVSNPTTLPNLPVGTYTFNLTVRNKELASCLATGSAQVEVLAKPQIELYGMSSTATVLSVCEEEQTTILINNAQLGAVSYTWSDPTGVLQTVEDDAVTTRTLLLSDNGAHISVKAALSDLSTCSSTRNIQFRVVEKPKFNASGRATNQIGVCEGSVVTLGENNNAYNYEWWPAAKLNNPTIAQPTTVALGKNEIIDFTVTVSRKLEPVCKSTSTVRVVGEALPTKYTISAPNGSAYCADNNNSEITVQVDGSDVGTEYALYTATGAPYGDGSWITSQGTTVQWNDVTQGAYMVKARRLNSEGDYCETNLYAADGNPLMITPKQSPTATLRNIGNVSCPGMPTNVEVDFNGVGPFTAVLYFFDAQNVLLETKVIADYVPSKYSFVYTPKTYTRVVVAEVSDSRGCTHKYDETNYPELVFNIPNVDLFKIQANPDMICSGDPKMLYIDYDPALYPDIEVVWSPGQTNVSSITVYPTEGDNKYSVTVTLPGTGCQIEDIIEVPVQDKLQLEIIGLEETYCADKKADPSTFPILRISPNEVSGKWSCTENANLMQGGTIMLNKVTKEGPHEIVYEVTQGACKSKVSATTHIYIKPEVNWTIGPAFLPVTDNSKAYKYCIPDPNKPEKGVSLQGDPYNPNAYFELVKADLNSATAELPKVVMTDKNLSQGKITGLTPGVYDIRFVVPSANTGCVAIAEKQIIIEEKIQTIVDPGSIVMINSNDHVAAGSKLCKEDDLASIKLENQVAIKSVTFSNNAINTIPAKDQTDKDRGIWYFTPSAINKVGDQRAIISMEDASGCPSSSVVNFSIVAPVSVHVIGLEKSYCSNDENVYPIGVDPDGTSTGTMAIYKKDETTGEYTIEMLSGIDVQTPPYFAPKQLGVGEFRVLYTYTDLEKVCTSTEEYYTTIYAPTDIDLGLKTDYCYGEEVRIESNPSSGIYAFESDTNENALVNGIFYTQEAGIGMHVISLTHVNKHGCTSKATADVYVRGTESINIFGLEDQYCAPQGFIEVEGSPNDNGKGYFTGCQHLTFVTPIADQAGDGKAVIDLNQADYNTEYTLFYHYEIEYTNATGTHTCVSTTQKDFKVLSEGVDFGGIKNNEVLCGDREAITITANRDQNVTFTFNDLNYAQSAFVDNGDGTATLYPKLLPEGGYYIQADYAYIEEGKTQPTCVSQKVKNFTISIIEEMTDLQFSCVDNKEISVCMKQTEEHVRYELVVNGTPREVQDGDPQGGGICFNTPLKDPFVQAYVKGIDNRNDACVSVMSKVIEAQRLQVELEKTNISCFDQNDGTITVTITGGEPSYKIELTSDNPSVPAQTGQNFTGLPDGKYYYTVEDMFGCKRTLETEITRPSELEVKFATKEPSCHAESDANGSARADVTMGTGTSPYTYEWIKLGDEGEEDQLITTNFAVDKLYNGRYKGVVTDNRGCQKSYAFYIEAPAQLQLSLVSVTHVANPTEAQGVIEVAATGGVPFVDETTGDEYYKFTWVGRSFAQALETTSAKQENLLADSYDIEVEDARGCTTVLKVKVNEPSVIQVVETIQHVSCQGKNDGAINLQISGGETPYKYMYWTYPDGTQKDQKDLTGLLKGSYVFKMEDANGNVFEHTYTVDEPSLLTIVSDLTSKLQIPCFKGTDGEINVTLGGGVQPYQIVWDGLTTEAVVSDDKTKVENLPAGLYTVKVTDANGCTESLSQQIIENTEMKFADVQVVQNSCHNENKASISIKVTGGAASSDADYSYTWSGVGIDPINVNNQNQTDLISGNNYKVVVTDLTGECTIERDFELINPDAFEVEAKATHISCSKANDGVVEAVVTGGTGNITYTWTDEAGQALSSGNYIENLSKGTYIVTAKDELGCERTAQAMVNEPEALSMQVASANISCNGLNDGWIEVSDLNGGSGNYSFTWEDVRTGNVLPQTTQKVKDLPASTYQVTMADAEHPTCTISQLVDITEPAQLAFDIQVEHVKQTGKAEGKIAITRTDTPADFVVTWLSGDGITDANRNDKIVSGLKAGLYVVELANLDGTCSAIYRILVEEPSALNVEVVTTNVACYNQATGILEVVKTEGGDGVYTYTWSTADGLRVVNNYIIDQCTAGAYILTVTDNSGNHIEKEYTISQPEEMIVSLVPENSKLAVTCYQSKDGAIELRTKGGTGDPTFAWILPDGTKLPAALGENKKTDLPKGSYRIVVEDQTGCTVSQVVEITEPASPIIIDATLQQIDCYGDTDGAILLQVSGENGDYTYEWTGGPGLQPNVANQTTLHGGETYQVHITDKNGCYKDAIFTLDAREPMNLQLSSTKVDCFGNNSGEVKAVVTGGTKAEGAADYERYYWTKENDPSYIAYQYEEDHLYAGTYIFQVTDAKGCTLTDKIEVEQPNALTATLDAESVLCNGLMDAEAYLLIPIDAGTPNISNTWYNGAGDVIAQDKSHLTKLGPDKYTIVLEDANGCTFEIRHEIKWSPMMIVDEPEIVDVEITGESTGSIKVSASGGTPNLKYIWTSNVHEFINPADPYQDRLPAGDYEIQIVDALGCSQTVNAEIKQPESMTIVRTIEDIKCAGEKGKINIDVQGGHMPYMITWSGPNGYNVQGENLFTIVDLLPGSYSLHVEDSKGNTLERSYSITERTPLQWNFADGFTRDQVSCHGKNDALITLEVSGGSPSYLIKWEGPGVTGKTGKVIDNLGPGAYKATVSDRLGCEADKVEFTVTEPDKLEITNFQVVDNTCAGLQTGAIYLDVQGGTGTLEYSWTGVNVQRTNQNQEGLPAGDYTVTISDEQNCTLYQEFTLVDPDKNIAVLAGNGEICEGEDVTLYLNLSGKSSWNVQYTDGATLYDKVIDERMVELVHQPEESCTFTLVKVEDANGCLATLSGEVPVVVHAVPAVNILSAETACCLGQSVYVDMVMGNEGPWSVTAFDGEQHITQRFTNAHDKFVITPEAVGKKTYTLQTITNAAQCTLPIDYSLEVTTYQNPTFEVQLENDRICQPNPLRVPIKTTGDLPLTLRYTFNGIPMERIITEHEEVIVVEPTAYEDVNTFVFESIASDGKCSAAINRRYTIAVDLLPATAEQIDGKLSVCRGSVVRYATPSIANADTYRWSFPEGFNIISGLGTSIVEVEVTDNAQGGIVSVCGVNACGTGESVTMHVDIYRPIAEGGAIAVHDYICRSDKKFTISVNELEGAQWYEWKLPKGLNNVAASPTASSITVEMDEYAHTSEVTVIPHNECYAGAPIKATVLIRENPLAEAGKDIIKPCKDASVDMDATPLVTERSSTKWGIMSGAASFDDDTQYNSNVDNLLYGENKLSWMVHDGYCFSVDSVIVTNNTPVATQPEATQMTICESFVTLRAPQPELGKTRWTLLSGDGEIANPNSNITAVTDLSNSSINIFRWEVYNDFCSDEVLVSVISNNLENITYAGEDGVSSNGSYRLSAANYSDSYVEGTWTLISGAGEIEDIHSPITNVVGLAQGINTFRWTLKGYDCEAYDEVQIRSVEEPVAGFNVAQESGCAPFTVRFDNITLGEATFVWDFGDENASTLRSPEHMFEKAGVYTVTLTATGKRKTDKVSKQITVLPSPEASFTVSSAQLYVPNAEAHFFNETEEAVSYYWDFGDGHASTDKDPVHTYYEDGEYDITYIVVDKNGCADTLKYENYIHVGKGSFIVFPTAFTPNVSEELSGIYSSEERRLDLFYPVSRNVDTYKLEIFNQWGNMVFSTDNLMQGWNGYYLNQPAAQGVYVFKAEGRFKDGTAFREGGSVLLIR